MSHYVYEWVDIADTQPYQAQIMTIDTGGYMIRRRLSIVAPLSSRNFRISEKQIYPLHTFTKAEHRYSIIDPCIGKNCYVLDSCNNWEEAHIEDISLIRQQVLIKYNEYGDNWNEWIDIDSSRLSLFNPNSITLPIQDNWMSDYESPQISLNYESYVDFITLVMSNNIIRINPDTPTMLLNNVPSQPRILAVTTIKPHIAQFIIASGNNCSICLEPYSTDLSMVDSCQHIFHQNCLNEWTEQSHTCPICRK